MRALPAGLVAVVALGAGVVAPPAQADPNKPPGPEVVEYNDPRPCEPRKRLIKVHAPGHYQGSRLRNFQMQLRVYWEDQLRERRTYERRNISIVLTECPIPREFRDSVFIYQFRWTAKAQATPKGFETARKLPWSRWTRVALAF